VSELLVVAGIAALAVLSEALLAITFARAQRSSQRQHARERELLINQLCNVVGRPWSPAPADEWTPTEEELFQLAAPEQLPDY
jgi:hypothetical protein